MGTFTIRPAEQQNVIDARNDTNIKNTINALAPYSGYTQVSKKLDNFVFKTDANFTYKVADKNRFVKFGDTVVDTYGPELITNGDFSNGTTGWSTVNSEYIVNGQYNVPATISSDIYLMSNNFSAQSGGLLKIEFNVAKAGTYSYLRIYDFNTSTYIYVEATAGKKTYYFKYNEAYPRLTFRFYDGMQDNFIIDNISVREIKTADFTNTVPDVAEVITNGSNTTSVAVSVGDYVIDGSELVTNGTFDTDISGWTIAEGTFSYNNGTVINTSTTFSRLYQDIPTTVGVKYAIKIGNNFNTGHLRVYRANGTTELVNSGVAVNGAKIYTFTALDTTCRINITSVWTSTVIDNISVRRVSDTFRAKQNAPIGTALTNTVYFEDRTSIGVTNQALAYHAYNTLTNAYEGIKTEVLFSDVSKEDLLDNPSWLARNGFSKVSQFLYSKGSYNAGVSGQYTTLNKGLFHPLLNYMGTRKASDDKYWYDTTVSFTSVADCFNPTKLLTASGNVASGKSGRPTGDTTLYYDVCYPSLYQDVREYSKILNRDEVKLIIADKEENGVDEVTYFGSTSLSTNFCSLYSTTGSIAFYTKSGNTLVVGNNVEFYLNGTRYTLYVSSIVSSSAFTGNPGSLNNTLFWTYLSNIFGNNRYITFGDLLSAGIVYRRKDNGTYSSKWESASTHISTKPILSSNTKLQPKAISNPTHYSQIMKDRLVSGNGIVGLLPDLVDDTGASNLPNGSKTVFKLNGKFTTTHQVLKSTDSGVTWSLLALTTHYTVNTITNSIAFVTAPASTDIILIADTDKCLPYIQATPLPVIDVEPKVIATNSHNIYKGALIGNQVSGKIQVGNGTNGYESKMLENEFPYFDDYFEYGVAKEYIKGKRYLTLLGGASITQYGVYARLGDTYTSTFATTYIVNDSSNWGLLYIINSSSLSHLAITLDNSNSPASKRFKAISQGTNGVVGSVYGMEFTAGGDTGSFSQLTNGTTTDWNGSTVHTFCGHIPINGEVE